MADTDILSDPIVREPRSAMSGSDVIGVLPEITATARPERVRSWVIGSLRRSPSGTVGASILVVFVVAAVAAPILSPYSPDSGSLIQRLSGPLNSGHLLGTDVQGRDILSRLLWGARPSLIVVFVPLAISVMIGLVLGAIAAVTGRFGRTVVNRGIDMLLGLPPVLLAILVSASIGSGLRNMTISITLVLVAPMTRIAYQAATVIRGQPYIEAARAAGARQRHLIVGQYIPNMLPPVIAYAASLASVMVVLGAGLSFLGLGIQPPQADWGRMINDGRLVVPVAPYVSIIPGVALFLLALGCNLVGDAMRDALDPRRRP